MCGCCAGEQKEGTSKFYVTIMKKVIEKGDSFIQTESARLKKVSRGGGGRGGGRGVVVVVSVVGPWHMQAAMVLVAKVPCAQGRRYEPVGDRNP